VPSTKNLPLPPFPPRAILPAVNYYATVIASYIVNLAGFYSIFISFAGGKQQLF
jgi:hypothetical protein